MSELKVEDFNNGYGFIHHYTSKNKMMYTKTITLFYVQTKYTAYWNIFPSSFFHYPFDKFIFQKTLTIN